MFQKAKGQSLTPAGDLPGAHAMRDAAAGIVHGV
jgi:hypothetical protein